MTKKQQKKIKADTGSYQFAAPVWIFAGPGGWHFVTLPQKLAGEISLFHSSAAKSFGSIAVTVTVGKTSWNTSIFRDTKSKSYVLPLKAEVRKKEKIAAGQKINVVLAL